MQFTHNKSLPLGTSTFQVLRDENEIYVDKTHLIFELCKRRNKIFLSRPRRFGKSLLVSTFESLFRYGLRDFSGLAIEKIWSDGIYRVAALDFSVIKDFETFDDFASQLHSQLAIGFRSAGYTGNGDFTDFQVWFSQQPGNSIVLLIDEYDAPLTACLDRPELFSAVQRHLSRFFSRIKSLEGCLRFFFMTGITKFSNTGIFSGFNNLYDISLASEYGSILGYTEFEIRKYFGEYITQAALTLNCTEDEIMRQLKKHYNGFCFDENASQRVYCPWSVLNFFFSPVRGFQNYWYQSGGRPTVLMKYLADHELADPASYAQPHLMRFDDVRLSSDYQSLRPEALLFQAGYLTIRSILDKETVELGYPNEEVSESMARLYAYELLGGKIYRRNGPSLMTLLELSDLDEIVKRFNDVFNAIDYHRYPVRDEATCRGFLQVLMIGADAVPSVEFHTALGRSDIQVDVGARRLVFELKYVQKDSEAPKVLGDGVRQARERRYGETYGSAAQTLLRSVLVFSAESRRFVCWASA